MRHLRASGLLTLALINIVLVHPASAADPLPAETRLVATTTAPTATSKEFDVATAQDLVVTLTDFGTPAALASASIVVTKDDAIVGRASLAPPASSATVALTGAVGHFTFRVVGIPDSAFSVGTFSVCVAPQPDPAACIQGASLAGNISAQGSPANPTVSTLSIDFNVTAAGTYTVTFVDDQFPAALNVAPNLALFQGSLPVSLGIPSGTALILNPGKYRLLSIAQADRTVKAGLYGITISGPVGTAPLLDDSFPVGSIAPSSTPNNPLAQSLTLKVTDYSFPSALTGASALVTFGGAKLGTASSAGRAISFPAPASTSSTFMRVWTYATAGADAGTYNVDLTAGSASLFSSPFGVGSGSTQAYAFVTPPLPAGSLQLTAKDFQFPATLQGLKFAVAQGGTIQQQSSMAGTLDFTVSAGSAVILAAAQTPTTGNGLFGVTVQTGGATPQILFDKAQGVSPAGLFDSQEIILGAGGGFDVTLTDLQFPVQFQDLALVVSRGGVVLGRIFGGGSFSIAGTPGTFQLTFIATPAAQQQYGLYAVKVVASAPTVTLTATPATLVAGESTTLKWTSADAETCTASGGNWTGSKALTTGSEVVKVDATTTFSLTCTGSGGSSVKNVNVTATPKPASSSGGGGSLDTNLLALLFGMLALRFGVGRHVMKNSRGVNSAAVRRG